MRGRHVIIVCLLVLSTVSAAGQQFKTEKLETAVMATGVQMADSTLSAGATILLKAKDGTDLCVRTDSSRVIEHIGIPLFGAEMRELMPSAVYDFMEYAVLNWKFKVSPNQLYLSKVVFQKGSWSTLATGDLAACECSISNVDNRTYVVSWRKDGEDIAIVGVPIEYELLNNDTRRNLEKDFIKAIEVYQLGKKSAPERVAVTEDALNIYGTEGLFVVPGECHILPELNQNVYYVLKTVYEKVDTVIWGERITMTLEDVMPVAVVDREYPAETLANLILSNDRGVPRAIMSLDFHLSNYHRQKVSISTIALRDFLGEQGCKMFFASSGTTDGTARGMLFVRNRASGYNHLLSVAIPVDRLTDAAPEIKADVYLYIPDIDKSRLYGKVPTKKSGAKIH